MRYAFRRVSLEEGAGFGEGRREAPSCVERRRFLVSRGGSYPRAARPARCARSAVSCGVSGRRGLRCAASRVCGVVCDSHSVPNAANARGRKFPRGRHLLYYGRRRGRPDALKYGYTLHDSPPGAPPLRARTIIRRAAVPAASAGSPAYDRPCATWNETCGGRRTGCARARVLSPWTPITSCGLPGLLSPAEVT